MVTNNEKEYLNCRINQIMELLVEVVQEMSKWETDMPSDLEDE